MKQAKQTGLKRKSTKSRPKPIQINDQAYAEGLYESDLLEELYDNRNKVGPLRFTLAKIIAHLQDKYLMRACDPDPRDEAANKACKRWYKRIKKYLPPKDYILRAK